ncbi:hypothetical protein RB195_024233 [Necator americanus]|uniref:Uncharacterized protein n=1 Tax=Necator americanus TaxID=51031 RepID=A0ABR1EPQ8_NECAM
MNLRAFVTNHTDIMNAISTKDRSSNLCPKALGIHWNSIADNFLLSINLPTTEFVSKQTVAQQIASIYNPLGWFIPLLVKAKRFQQLLRKEQYDSDEPLNEEHRRHYNENIQLPQKGATECHTRQLRTVYTGDLF